MTQTSHHHTLVCAACGFVAVLEHAQADLYGWTRREDGTVICPDCGGKSTKATDAAKPERVDAPS